MWGGLRPIGGRLALDVATIASLAFCAFTVPNGTNHVVLGLATIVTVGSAGLTQRWTISFPLLPFLILQVLRSCALDLISGTWMALIIGILSTLLILSATALSVLFPAVQLSSIPPGQIQCWNYQSSSTRRLHRRYTTGIVARHSARRRK